MVCAAVSIAGIKICEAPPDHSKGDEVPSENVAAYLAHILSIQNAGPTGALQIYSFSAAASGLPTGNNMIVAVAYGLSAADAKSRAYAEAAASGIKIEFFEDGYDVSNAPTGGFAKEMREAAAKTSLCVLAPFEGTPRRPVV
jgi:hypothetical protein